MGNLFNFILLFMCTQNLKWVSGSDEKTSQHFIGNCSNYFTDVTSIPEYQDSCERVTKSQQDEI